MRSNAARRRGASACPAGTPAVRRTRRRSRMRPGRCRRQGRARPRRRRGIRTRRPAISIVRSMPTRTRTGASVDVVREGHGRVARAVRHRHADGRRAAQRHVRVLLQVARVGRGRERARARTVAHRTRASRALRRAPRDRRRAARRRAHPARAPPPRGPARRGRRRAGRRAGGSRPARGHRRRGGSMPDARGHRRRSGSQLAPWQRAETGEPGHRGPPRRAGRERRYDRALAGAECVEREFAERRLDLRRKNDDRQVELREQRLERRWPRARHRDDDRPVGDREAPLHLIGGRTRIPLERKPGKAAARGRGQRMRGEPGRQSPRARRRRSGRRRGRVCGRAEVRRARAPDAQQRSGGLGARTELSGRRRRDRDGDRGCAEHRGGRDCRGRGRGRGGGRVR